MSDFAHGTPNGYTNCGCRCEPCKRAHADDKRARRIRLAERGAADPSAIPHGTEGGYHEWKCRCEVCREAWAAAARRRRERRRAQAAAR